MILQDHTVFRVARVSVKIVEKIKFQDLFTMSNIIEIVLGFFLLLYLKINIVASEAYFVYTNVDKIRERLICQKKDCIT